MSNSFTMDPHWFLGPRCLFTHALRMSRNSEIVFNDIWDALKLLLNRPLAGQRTHPKFYKHKSLPVDQLNLRRGFLTVGTDKRTSSSWLWFISVISSPLLLLFWAMTTLNIHWAMESVKAEIELVIFFFHLDSFKSAFSALACLAGLPVPQVFQSCCY